MKLFKDFWKIGAWTCGIFAVLCLFSFLTEPTFDGFLTMIFFAVFAVISKHIDKSLRILKAQKQIN